MFMHDNTDGGKTIILDVGDKPLVVELPGGNGNTYTIYPDGAIVDEDGTDMRKAYWQA